MFDLRSQTFARKKIDEIFNISQIFYRKISEFEKLKNCQTNFR